ncbi:hypothetical protein L423_02563 [Enterobacter roggenkampii]|uniref:gp53-like domain-containing protein n=1 Tax=Enterobacter roggenkampii TaxID=1812935 RepID=UPI0003BE5893|nr:hypothetical protein [Enterobacter roggenkampii]ESL80404.1 hypothetical protein L423_02563 [Enterobacter roggenkampii]
MFHLDNNSGVSAMPPVGAVQSSAPRWYTEGGGGTPASYPGADWYNIIQAELLNLLSAYGINPNKSDFNQLQHAIEEAISQNATANSALLTAIADLVTSANKMPYFTGKDKVAMTDLTAFARTLLGRSDAAGVLSDLGLGDIAKAGVGKGVASDNGFFTVPVLIAGVKTEFYVQWGKATVSNSTGVITLPVAFPNKRLLVLANDITESATSVVTFGINTDASKSSFTFFSAIGSSAFNAGQFAWLAIGY